MSQVEDVASRFWLSPFRVRNFALDAFFYDIAALTADEVVKLALSFEMKGSIVVVSPRAAGKEIRLYRKALRFMTREGHHVRAIVVAGVGSSVLGTAALARNVADALGADVAGVVSGYGLADVVQEGLGGWFWFGGSDRVEREIERLLLLWGTKLPQAKARRIEDESGMELVLPGQPGWGVPGEEDASVLFDILMAEPKRLALLVGHSKGSLVIDAALEQFVDALEGDDHAFYRALHVVTFGAVADLPREFSHRSQRLGELDLLGALNSRDLPHRRVPGAGHHTNTRIPCRVDVEAEMRGYLDRTLLPAG